MSGKKNSSRYDDFARCFRPQTSHARSQQHEKTTSTNVAESSKEEVSFTSSGDHLTMNENAATEIRRGSSVEGVLQRCGICSLLSSLVRRAMCVGSRRGSGESSYYQELPEAIVVPDITIMEPKNSVYSRLIPDPFSNKRVSLSSQDRILFDALIAEENSLSPKKRHYSNGRFLTMHKRRRKKLQTRSLSMEPAVLDDILHGQVACILKQVGNWRFNAFSLENVTGGRSLSVLCVHLFYSYGLMSHFNLDPARLWKLFSLIEEGYHSSNPYHNSIHATDVTQAMHCFLQETRILEHLEPLEILASLLGAVCHDLDHPGVNQPFLIATSNHLAALYENTSVLENHHWRSAIGCLLDSGVAEQISEIRPELEKQISSLILATDITRQQEFIGIFKDFLNNNTLNMRNSSHRHFILQIALKCADISNPCRPWDVSKKWSLKVCEEFFRQGDFERQLNLPVTSLCDRFSTTVPKIQTGFFKFVVSPLMVEWHRFLKTDLSYRMMKHLRYNEKQWDTRLQNEMAEETRTEISDADVLDEDDFDDKNGADEADEYSSQRYAGSPEMTLPEIKSSRRSSLQIPTYSLKDKDRRLSVPLHNVPKIVLPNKDPSRMPAEVLLESEENELGSLSILSSDSESGQIARSSIDSNDNERPLSAENLLPDLNIASMTDSICADKLNIVMHGSTNFPAHMLNVSTSKHLIRQQTFPPLQPCVRTRYMSSTAELGTYPEALFESHSSTSSSESLHNESKVSKTTHHSKHLHQQLHCQLRGELKRDFEQQPRDATGKISSFVKMPKLSPCETSGQKENLDPKMSRKNFNYRRGSAPMSSTSTATASTIFPTWKPIGGRDSSPQHRQPTSDYSRRLSVPAESLGVRDNTSVVATTLKSTDALIPSTVNPNSRRSSSSHDGNNKSSISNGNGNGKRQNNRKFLRRKSSGGFENLSENLISKVGSVSTSILSSSSRVKQLRGTAESETISYNTKRRGSLPTEALTMGLGGTFRH